MNKPLYEVAAPLADLIKKIEDGEIEQEVAMDTLDSLLPVVKEKGVNVAAVVLNKEADIKALKEAELRIKARRERLQKSMESLKGYLLENMQACGIEEISCPEFLVKRAKNPPRVEVEDMESLPLNYVKEKVTRAPDKTLIKKAIESGEEIQGASITRGERLIFK